MCIIAYLVFHGSLLIERTLTTFTNSNEKSFGLVGLFLGLCIVVNVVVSINQLRNSVHIANSPVYALQCQADRLRPTLLLKCHIVDTKDVNVRWSLSNWS